MRYVTEDDLRGAYAAEPFARYALPSDAKLTPSARQFLVDFRIDVIGDGAAAAPRAAAKDAPGSADTAVPAAGAPVSHGALLDDVRLLGAKLRLLAHRALGVDATLARACDELGHAWLHGLMVADAEAPRADGAAGAQGPCTPLEPALLAPVHPLYFEVAVIDAELARAMRFWDAACADLDQEDRHAVRAWLGAAEGLRATIAACAARAEKEAYRG